MRLGRTVFAGALAGAVSFGLMLVVILPVAAVLGRQQVSDLFSGSSLAANLLSFVPALMLGAIIGALVLTPYAFYREKHALGLRADLLAGSLIPVVIAFVGVGTNPSALSGNYALLAVNLVIMVLASVPGMFLFRRMMGRSKRDQLIDIFEG